MNAILVILMMNDIRTSHTNNRKQTANTEKHIEKLDFSTIFVGSRTDRRYFSTSSLYEGGSSIPIDG